MIAVQRELAASASAAFSSRSSASPVAGRSPSPLRLAYVTQFDATDIRPWSGAGFYIAKALMAGGAALDLIGPLRIPHQLLRKSKQFAYRMLGKHHLRDREPPVIESYASQIKKRLATSTADIVFSPSTLPIGRLQCVQPIAIWIDCTFAKMVDYYPTFSGLSRATLRNGHALEQAALDAAKMVIFASEWAAQGALESYRLDRAKMHVVPFGGNVDIQHGMSEIDALVDTRPAEHCKLLFIGGDWWRKGGDIAVSLARALNEAGLPTTLTIIGRMPVLTRRMPDYVRPLGTISKQTEAGRARYESELRNAHFLLAPSRRDCSPLAPCEANAFGVPCLASAVGGLPEIVHNGVNGFIASGERQIERHRDIVLSLFTDRDAYRSLARTSFESFQTRLNWTVSGRAVCNLLSTL